MSTTMTSSTTATGMEAGKKQEWYSRPEMLEVYVDVALQLG
jgi:hypothetical protein